MDPSAIQHLHVIETHLAESQGETRYLLPETHSIIREATHMQETVITQNCWAFHSVGSCIC